MAPAQDVGADDKLAHWPESAGEYTYRVAFVALAPLERYEFLAGRYIDSAGSSDCAGDAGSRAAKDMESAVPNAAFVEAREQDGARAFAPVVPVAGLAVAVLQEMCSLVTVVLASAGVVVLLSREYHSGFPWLSTFRFPALQDSANIAPFSLVVLDSLAECCFDPLRRVLVSRVS